MDSGQRRWNSSQMLTRRSSGRRRFSLCCSSFLTNLSTTTTSRSICLLAGFGLLTSSVWFASSTRTRGRKRAHDSSTLSVVGSCIAEPHCRSGCSTFSVAAKLTCASRQAAVLMRAIETCSRRTRQRPLILRREGVSTPQNTDFYRAPLNKLLSKRSANSTLASGYPTRSRSGWAVSRNQSKAQMPQILLPVAVPVPVCVCVVAHKVGGDMNWCLSQHHMSSKGQLHGLILSRLWPVKLKASFAIVHNRALTPSSRVIK